MNEGNRQLVDLVEAHFETMLIEHEDVLSAICPTLSEEARRMIIHCIYMEGIVAVHEAVDILRGGE